MNGFSEQSEKTPWRSASYESAISLLVCHDKRLEVRDELSDGL